MFGLDRRLIGSSTKKWINVGVLSGIASVMLTMALVTIIGIVIDNALKDNYVFMEYLPWLIAILIAKGFFGWSGRLGQYHASSETKLTVRDKIYEHALRLGPGILGRKRTGELVNMAVDGMEWLELYFGVYFVQFLIGLSTPLLLCIFVFYVDWVVGAVLAISIPLTPVFLGAFAQRFSSVSKRYFEMNSHLSAQFLDNLQGMTTLKLFNQAVPRGTKVREEVETNRVETMRLLLVNQIMIFFTDFGFALSTTVAMTVTALIRMNNGFVTPGEVVALVLISSEFARPLNLIGAFFFAGAIGREVAKNAGSFLDEEIEIKETEDGKEPSSVETDIEFENVTFTYAGSETPALSNVSMKIKSGETVALIGKSGSGKTTVTNLLMRLFKEQEGVIRIGGHSLNNLNLDWLRTQLALVPQNPYLFYGSFAENLRIAKEDATQEEMEAAAKAANLHDFIAASPEGYETMIGEQGMSLSGGQAQRLAIARALLKGSPIVILDEPTSQIDVESEAVIQEAINHLTKDKTVILIAHRLSTVEHADRIIVLDNGCVIEEGTAAELLTKAGAYSHMISTHDAAMEVA